MPIVKASPSRQVVIPKTIWDKFNLPDNIYFSVEERLDKNEIVFKPKDFVDHDPYYWSPAVQKEMKLALKDVREGRVKRFASLQELAKDLES